MAAYPGSAPTLHGALVIVHPVTRVPEVVPFQYNPHTLSRSYEVQGGVGGPEAGQLAGPPSQTISLELVLDATDAQEAGEGTDGVAPQIAALVGLVTPHSTVARAALAQAASGGIEVLPPPGPVTLFVWGAKRVEPVAVTGLTVTEELHDGRLTPLLARVTLSVRVLTYADLAAAHPGHALSMAGQVAREQLASQAVTASFESVLGADVTLN